MSCNIDQNLSSVNTDMAEQHLHELVLRHKGLFEALMKVEGIDDDTSSSISRDHLASSDFIKVQSLQPSNENLIRCQENFLAGNQPPDSERQSLSSFEDFSPYDECEKSSWRQKLYVSLMQNYVEIMDALSVTNEDLEKIVEPPKPLNVSELRHNIKRCIKQSKPFTDAAAGVYDVITWKSPLLSLFMFWIYLCSIFSGYLISILLGLLFAQMIINYLRCCKQISLGLNLLPHRETTSLKFDLSGAQLLIELSRLMQIYLDYAADILEKIKNLFLWKVPRTSWVFTSLVLYWLVLSIFLTTSNFFTIVGFGIGFKLFITTYLFYRFPLLRHKLDIIVWFLDRLPADKPLRETKMDSTKNESSSSTVFYLPKEKDVSTVDQGSQKKVNNPIMIMRKCALFDSEKSFPFNVGSGKLKITNNQITFKYSRFNAGARDLIDIHLDEILSVKKTKTVRLTNWGDGSSIEIYVAGRQKPYVFAGIFGRDICFDQLILMGKACGLTWAN